MKKLFTNDKFFAVVSILGFLGSIIFSTGCFAFWSNVLELSYASSAIITLLNGIFVLMLYISYKNHNKNLMKGLIGALLMGYFACMCTLSFPVVITFPLDMVCNYSLLVISLIVLVNHMIINSNRYSSKGNILLNQICTVVAAVIALVWVICWIPYLEGIVIVFQLITSIGIVCLITSVVCVESRLDTYRSDREEAGWTEEKGYPEGYVHEYQKNQK